MTERGERAPTIAHPRPPWNRKKELLLVDLLRLATAAASTTASRPWSAACCTPKAVLADQLAHVEERSVDGLDLAPLTDGLRAEREQG